MHKSVTNKACKDCLRLVSGKNVCPVCGSQDLTSDFEGYLVIIDPSNSVFAQILHTNVKGEYALRISK